MINTVKTQFQRIFHAYECFVLRCMTLGIPILMWIFLGGQAGRPSALDSGNLSIFKFNQPTKVETPTWVYWAMGGIAITAGLGIFFLMQRKKKEAAAQIQKVATEKAHLRLDIVLSKLNVLPPERKLLEEIANATHPDDLLPMVESVEEFEQKVVEFKKEKRESKVLKAIYHLRHKLGYDFHNKRASFITTQMLAGGLKLECQIPHEKKEILFVSPILTVSESGILLKPPTIKKKPVNLKKYPHLTCRIRREEEADYEFQLPIINQIFGKPNAIILGHTDDIKKMYIREAERIQVDIFTTFSVMSEEQLSAASGAAKTDMVVEAVNGKIVDISVGGLKAVLEEKPAKLDLGDLMIFHLQGANLRDDLKGRVLGINQLEKGISVHMQFFRSRELERMKIKKFVFNAKKQNDPDTSNKTKKKPSAAAPRKSDAVSANERGALLQ